MRSACDKIRNNNCVDTRGTLFCCGGVLRTLGTSLGGGGVCGGVSHVLRAYGGAKRVRTLLLSVVSFYSANLLLGGCLEAVYSLSGRRAAPRFGAVIAAAALGCFAIRELCARGRRARSAETAECGITLCGNEKKVRLLCDSGNLLRDPYNGNGVIILSGKVFPEIAEKLRSSDLVPLSAAKPRIIPASFAGGTGMLYGLVPERVSVSRRRRFCNDRGDCGALAGRQRFRRQRRHNPGIACCIMPIRQKGR